MWDRHQEKPARRWTVLVGVALAALTLAPTIAPQGAARAEWSPPEIVLAADAFAARGGAPCTTNDPVPAQLQRLGLVEFTDEPGAGDWATWYVDPADLPVDAPPATLSAQTAEELAELQQIAATRNNTQILTARSYDGVPTRFWTELYLELIIQHSDKNGIKNPPTLSRQIALFEQAMYDALVVTWGAKYCHDRLPPSMLDPALRPIVEVGSAPSYPSEHAAVAGAAAVMMAYFFPANEEPAGRFDGIAREIAESRLWGGANYRSDVEAGLAIGYAVGQAVVDARDGDGWNAVWDGTGQITGTCHWSKTLPKFGGPLMPKWGDVTPFLMTDGAQFLPPPPPTCDGETYLAQVRDLYDVSLGLTPRQREIADRWAGGQGTVTPPGQWINLALNMTIADDLNTMRQARVMAYAGAALGDAAISSWNTKFTYWSDRPIHGIQRLHDPAWTPLIATPPFPGYVSGHSTFGGAVTQTLAHFFPERDAELSSYATEAALSRYYGGIHIRADNDWGRWSGEHIAALATLRASEDGAE